ncbi:MFS transporter [Allopusillimonas soli]|uniref:MFS transporter n=1 Tax=Allopusillimonas soli TaxID=659016 RepID=A0A853FGP6_9BURK|nr:MFS transporter [Allopusillimonas soli]NYT38812.1 MFS transporter [Allopusillimonas soli]TEA70212.1 MFS transporter [Allopusillimonas soli]
MVKTIAAFFSLYLATLLLLISSGLFNTYMGLRLTAEFVSELWVGGLIAAYYTGLVFGARIGHRIIIRVGHIRAYAVTAAVATVTILVLALVDNLWVWLGFRFLAGIAMVTQFMVLESWLNEQTENRLRGRVFAFYMVCSSCGTVLGQLALTLFPRLNYEPLIFAAMCSVLCLIPIAMTSRLHPTLQMPAPIHARYYRSRVPISLLVVFMAGALTGAFYGLAPVYALKQGLNNSQVAVFLAAAVAAGLIAQWPLGWLADRVNRVGMIRINALALMLVVVPLWGWWIFPYWALVVFSCVQGALLFTLYPLGAAFANDNVDPDRRVGLSAILYMVYGVGASLGPLAAGLLMRGVSEGMYFVFLSLCALVLVAFVRPQKVTGANLSDDAPTQFVPMSDSLQSSNVVATLDPRVDVESDVSFETPAEELEGQDDKEGAADPGDGTPGAGTPRQEGAATDGISATDDVTPAAEHAAAVGSGAQAHAVPAPLSGVNEAGEHDPAASPTAHGEIVAELPPSVAKPADDGQDAVKHE